MPLGQFGHGELRVPAVVSHVPIVGAEFGVFKAVAAHLGVLVVDGVNEDENDGNDNHCESHKSSDERKVVLCEENNAKGNENLTCIILCLHFRFALFDTSSKIFK